MGKDNEKKKDAYLKVFEHELSLLYVITSLHEI